MKRILIALFILPVVCIAQEKDFVIHGLLKGLPDNTPVTIKNEEVSENSLAKAVAKAGRFELKGKLSEPNLYYISFEGSSQRLYIFLDASDINIKGHKDSLTFASVTGSPSHKDFQEFNATFNPLFSKLNPLVQDLNAGKPDPENKKRLEYQNIVNEVNNKADGFVKSHQASPVAALTILVLSQLAPGIEVTEDRYLQLTPAVKDSYFGRMLNQNITEAKIGAIGTDAIDFVQNDTTGKPVSLSSFRGKFVLIDFWASWCKPCRMENPNVVEAYKKFSGKNFTVLGVSLDRSREPWIKAIKDDNLAWTQVSDLKFWNNEVAAKYKVGSIPQNFLIDPNGKIIARDLRGEELHQRLEQLLQ